MIVIRCHTNESKLKSSGRREENWWYNKIVQHSWNLSVPISRLSSMAPDKSIAIGMDARKREDIVDIKYSTPYPYRNHISLENQCNMTRRSRGWRFHCVLLTFIECEQRRKWNVRIWAAKRQTMPSKLCYAPKVRNVNRIWECWHEVSPQNIKLTLLGTWCLVETFQAIIYFMDKEQWSRADKENRFQKK